MIPSFGCWFLVSWEDIICYNGVHCGLEVTLTLTTISFLKILRQPLRWCEPKVENADEWSHFFLLIPKYGDDLGRWSDDLSCFWESLKANLPYRSPLSHILTHWVTQQGSIPTHNRSFWHQNSRWVSNMRTTSDLVFRRVFPSNSHVSFIVGYEKREIFRRETIFFFF